MPSLEQCLNLSPLTLKALKLEWRAEELKQAQERLRKAKENAAKP